MHFLEEAGHPFRFRYLQHRTYGLSVIYYTRKRSQNRARGSSEEDRPRNLRSRCIIGMVAAFRERFPGVPNRGKHGRSV